MGRQSSTPANLAPPFRPDPYPRAAETPGRGGATDLTMEIEKMRAARVGEFLTGTSSSTSSEFGPA